jgi:hypothetical protein
MKDTHKTAVQFRKLKGEIIAVFPYEIEGRNTVLSYAHIGQHSEASWHINSFTRSASPSEYIELKTELENIGYNLDIIKRRSHKRYLDAYYSANKPPQPQQIDLRKIFNL